VLLGASTKVWGPQQLQIWDTARRALRALVLMCVVQTVTWTCSAPWGSFWKLELQPHVCLQQGCTVVCACIRAMHQPEQWEP
jgi:hypothetical protein